MTLDEFVATYKNQSVLYNTTDASLRGQCVQLVCFYCRDVIGSPVIWANAAQWWGQFPASNLAPFFTPLPYPANEPQRGDICIFGPGLPGSNGSGHICVCLSKPPGSSVFYSFDSNWGGQYAHEVAHNTSFLLGMLRPKNISAATGGKGGNEVDPNTHPNDGDVDNAYLIINNRKANDQEKRVYTSKTWGAPDGLYYGKILVDLRNIMATVSRPGAPATPRQLMAEQAIDSLIQAFNTK